MVYVGVDNKNEVNSLKENLEKLGKIYDKESEVKSLNKN